MRLRSPAVFALVAALAGSGSALAKEPEYQVAKTCSLARYSLP